MNCQEQQLISSKSTLDSAAAAVATHSQLHMEPSITELRDKHRSELQNLTLTTQPLNTIRFFFLAIAKSLEQSVVRVSAKSRWLVLISTMAAASAVLVRIIDQPYEEHVQESMSYLRFSLWWLALGVASSIGLGSGLHTFVLYLGPHIALFTMKCVQCGRVDIKSAPYDTIQLSSGPSWLKLNCSEYESPLYYSPGSRIPLLSILNQVQLEAVLWGIGTALGELPPYFISRAAHKSGEKLELMEDHDSPSKENIGMFGNHLNHIKQWLVSHSQHLNFFTILILASVPNPLFDLAGIMCGQFGVPFWEFFMATLIGKAVIKTHIQTAFIISVCNNQLLDLLENKLVWVLSFSPGVASILPSLIAKLHIIREKYMEASFAAVQPNIKVKKWDLSLGSFWNMVVWIMLINFLAKIVNSTAQGFLKEQQDKELSALEKSSSN